MQKVYAVCILAASVAADRWGEAPLTGNVPHGRSLLQKAVEIDDNERKSLTTSLDLDVKIMEREVANMQEKMKVVEDTLGVAATAEDKTGKTSLQQTANERHDTLQIRMNLLETNVADLLSRTIVVEKEVGVPQVSLVELDMTKDPAMGLANRAIGAYLKVHNLQRRIAKMEHAVVNGLKPDAMLLKKEVGVLEGKVNTLKASVQGTASSLLAIGSSEEGLKSQVSDLEMRVGELLSTTATLETEVHGLASKREESLLQKEKPYGKQGLVPRVSVLKDKVSSLTSRVFTLEHHVTGL